MEVILLSAGKGIRTNLGYPKQFYPINGKPSIVMSLELFDGLPEVEKIFVTYNREFKSEYEKIFKDYHIGKAVLIEGGKTRQESVFEALKHVKSSRVIIHEAARPLISKEFVYDILSYSEEAVVVPALPISFTVSEGQDYMTKILDRNRLRNIQLPQLFDSRILREVHQKAKDEGFEATEDSMLAFKYGYPVRFVAGLETNIKITTSLDILIVNHIVRGIRE
ncbi:MAG: 2-C-methyl-D-erythritol 4-phosphate cytidylyltransferase [Alphaproteobacteria bacterium]|nr:2-C-methyl-D-erythritol 4-phosphate cytidylyltransferase [Alphaproteobacteria bacterium]